MEKYTNGKIYKIVNTVDENVYIGSTVNKLCKRMGDHRTNHLKKQSKVYKHMQNIGIEHFKILLVKFFPCGSKDELEAEEFNTMQLFNQDLLLNENTVFKKRSAEHVKKITDGMTGNKSIWFKNGSIFKISNPSDAWVFCYIKHDPNKRAIRFQFSIKKYGDEGAKQLAEDKQKEIYPAME